MRTTPSLKLMMRPALRPAFRRSARAASAMARSGTRAWTRTSARAWGALVRRSAGAWGAAARVGAAAWRGARAFVADRPLACGIAIGVVVTLCLVAAVGARRERRPRPAEGAPLQLAAGVHGLLGAKRQAAYLADSLAIETVEWFAPELRKRRLDRSDAPHRASKRRGRH